MRWLASWALYWIGHVCYLGAEYLYLPLFRAYQFFMGMSVRVQGDYGPWESVNDVALQCGIHCAEIEPE